MGALRPLTIRSDERAVRWLWFAVAYIAAVVLFAWLGHQFAPPVSPPTGWFE